MKQRQQQRPRFIFIDHTADVGIEAYGSSIEELFENAAFGMASIIIDLEAIAPKKTKELSVAVSGSTLEDLLLNWLRELLYLHETQALIFLEFKVESIKLPNLKAAVKFVEIDDEVARYITGAIKAVTFHNLQVKKTGGGWSATVIFDV